MKRLRLSFNTLAALAVLLIANTLAHAQTDRTWVSGTGNDGNPCSRTAPCKTFAGAYAKTNAGGEIDVIDPGAYGQLTISKALTIDGGGLSGGILAGGGNGIVVNVPAGTVVTIRNVAIFGVNSPSAGPPLNGIRLIQAGKLHVEHCEIYNFTQKGIDISPTGAAEVYVKDSFIHNNGGAGIGMSPGAGGSVRGNLDNVRSETNQNGFVEQDNTKVSVRNSVAAGNASNGFLAIGSASGSPDMLLESCITSNNGTNGVRTQGNINTKIRISNVTITNNATGISIGAGSVLSAGNNTNQGNIVDGAPTMVITQQ
jgi:Right handed beta helix region